MPRNPLLKGLAPMHPGEHLREDILPALGKPKAEIARLLGISRLNCKTTRIAKIQSMDRSALGRLVACAQSLSTSTSARRLRNSCRQRSTERFDVLVRCAISATS